MRLHLLVLFCISIFACAEHKPEYGYEDYIQVLRGAHPEKGTTTTTFIEAKNYLSADTVHSSSIYLKLSNIQYEINRLKAYTMFEPLYGRIPPDEEIYAFHSSPGDALVSQAISSILKTQLSSGRISDDVLIEAWNKSPYDKSGRNLINELDLNDSDNIDLIEKEMFDRTQADISLKYLAASSILDKQESINYKLYAEIVLGIHNYTLPSFILLFDNEKHGKRFLDHLSGKEKGSLIKELERRTKGDSSNPKNEKIDLAIRFLMR